MSGTDKNINVNNSTPLNQKWLKAAIIGSTWAAFEIIVGSFLHNLRIPFAGTMLSMVGVFLLISYMQVWNERGLIIKAGLICALMKSISPSAIILGPMIGIFMEAVILEFLIFVLGRNLLGYMIGGAFGVLWALWQKVLSLLAVYGSDLIKIAKAFCLYLVKVSGLQDLPAQNLILSVMAFYLVLGAFAGYLGYIAGKSYKKRPATGINSIRFPSGKKQMSLNITEQNKYSFAYLWLIIAAIVLNLYLVNAGMQLEAIISGAAFMVFCLSRYKNTTRLLKKPSVWMQFIIITVVAALLWDWFSTGRFFSERGLVAGLEMNYRALIVIAGFSSVSVELRNPIIKSISYKRGFAKLHDSLSIAFNTLPVIIDSLPKPRNMIRKRKEVISNLISQSEILLNHFEKQGKE